MVCFDVNLSIKYIFWICQLIKIIFLIWTQWLKSTHLSNSTHSDAQLPPLLAEIVIKTHAEVSSWESNAC